jgi:hypothetical protein
MITNLRFTGLLIFLCGFLQLSVHGQFSITGTWELVYIAPTDMDDTDPCGITNLRLYFTQEGKLFNIFPDEILSDSTQSVKYNFEQNKLKILHENQEPYIINVSFKDSSTMIFTFEMSSLRIFKRMPEPDAANKIIETKSLQLVNTGSATKNTSMENIYDSSEFSSVPIRERINGVWEIVEYQNVPAHEMPPYGFLNDIWKIKNNEMEIINRATRDTTKLKYLLTDNESIILTATDGSKQILKISFNQWGQMILNFGDGIIILKLVTKDINKVPFIPLKVVLLKLAGEK